MGVRCLQHKGYNYPTEVRGYCPAESYIGYTHLAFSLGSENSVDELTKQLISDGYKILDGPRRTGDGYYESIFLDPESNRIELTI